MPEVTLFAAFVAGLLSFLSPCVLPLIPAYVSFIAGLSIEELQSGEKRPGLVLQISLKALFFVLGFGLVFVLLGASASALGKFLLGRLQLFNRLAGVVIIIFGLHLSHLLPLKFLYYEKKLQVNKEPAGFVGSFLVGMAFAFGWTPCIGPILAGILAYASTRETMYQGILLLAVYSLGLGLPFILTALSINSFLLAFEKIKRYFGLIEKAGGILLILVGLLILTDNFTLLAAYLQP